MKRFRTRLGGIALPSLLLMGVSCWASLHAEPSHPYMVRPILQIGAKAGDIPLPSTSDQRFFVGALTDDGQFAFGVGPSLTNRYYQGGLAYGKPDWLFHYAKNEFTPIVVPGAEASATNWRKDVGVLWPVGMNQSGNIAFSVVGAGNPPSGTYIWNAAEQKSILAVATGMPAPDGGRNLTFTQAGGFGTAINNHGDVVLTGAIKDPNGPDGAGLFFLGRDGKMLPILLPGGTLPGGTKLNASYFPQPSINDLGMVAFLARRQGDAQTSAFLWAQGNIWPIALQGAEVPGGKISAVTGVFLNDRDNHQLITASVKSTDPAITGSRHAVYRVVDGKFLAVAVPGQKMPGGGVFRSLQNVYSISNYYGQYDSATICQGVSPANRWGWRVILATLEDGSTAAYRMDNRGVLQPVLKSGWVVKGLGTITRVGVDSPAAINRYDQIVLSVRINNGAPTLVALFPNS